jgi:hypothetical protein
MYVSMSEKEIAEVRADLVVIEKTLEGQRKGEIEAALAKIYNRRPTDQEVAGRMAITATHSDDKVEEIECECPCHHPGVCTSIAESGTVVPVHEKEEMRQKVVQLTADVLRRDAHIVRLLQQNVFPPTQGSSSAWPLPQVTVEHL